jgi:hypothetical protein
MTQRLQQRTPLSRFEQIIPAPTHPKIAGISSHDARSWCESRKAIPAPAWLIDRLDKKNVEPFKGFAADGNVDPSVYSYAADEGAPVDAMVEKAEALFAVLDERQRSDLKRGSPDVSNAEFRLWSNPEVYINPGISIRKNT